MKICLLNNLFGRDARGGAERVVETIARGLRHAGHDVFVITTKKSGHSIERSEDRIYRFRPWNLFWYGDINTRPLWIRIPWHMIDIFNIHAARVVRKILLREKPDVVMTHNMKGIGYLIPRMIRKLGIRHVHTVHDVQLVKPSGLLWAESRNMEHGTRNIIRMSFQNMYTWFCRTLFHSPDVVVSPSRWLMDFYVARGFFQTSRRVILPNPVEVSRHATRDTRQKDDGMFRLLFVGQIEKHKGIFFLIDTLKNLKPKTYTLEFTLDIVGDGSMLEEIKERTKKNQYIHIHGRVGKEKIGELYENADALVVPSLVHENAPTVIFEAQSYGLPVIASRVGGIPEFVKDGETGWLFPAGDSKALRNILRHIFQHKKTLAPLESGIPPTGRAAIKKHFSPIDTQQYVQSLLRSMQE